MLSDALNTVTSLESDQLMLSFVDQYYGELLNLGRSSAAGISSEGQGHNDHLKQVLTWLTQNSSTVLLTSVLNDCCRSVVRSFSWWTRYAEHLFCDVCPCQTLFQSCCALKKYQHWCFRSSSLTSCWQTFFMLPINFGENCVTRWSTVAKMRSVKLSAVFFWKTLYALIQQLVSFW